PHKHRLSPDDVLSTKLGQLHPHPHPTLLGGDLGVNILLAATDGATVCLASGRGGKAVIPWLDQTPASLPQAQSKKLQGALRWKRWPRRTYQELGKTTRQVRDATHKAPMPSPRRSPARCGTWGSRSTTRPTVPTGPGSAGKLRLYPQNHGAA